MRASGGGPYTFRSGTLPAPWSQRVSMSARVVAAMVVVQVREEQVRDAGRGDAELEQPMMRAEAVVEHQHIRADIYDVAGRLPAQGGVGVPVPKSRMRILSCPNSVSDDRAASDKAT